MCPRWAGQQRIAIEITNLQPQDEFKSVILVIEEAILATDLAIYFKRRGDTFKLVETGGLDWSDRSHRSLIRGHLMTACDLGAITKPWDIQQKIARLVSDEFFYQGTDNTPSLGQLTHLPLR